MFVACLGSQKVIVGCCSVKKGMDEIKPEPDSQTGSIWRMSVDESYRGYGTATALMAACETWSRKAGCTKMGLFTINPVAANFYVNRMGYTAVDHFHVAKTAFSKLVVPPVFQYEKALC
jgi:GNAT superfamily N-acetyltransferase